MPFHARAASLGVPPKIVCVRPTAPEGYIHMHMYVSCICTCIQIYLYVYIYIYHAPLQVLACLLKSCVWDRTAPEGYKRMHVYVSCIRTCIQIYLYVYIYIQCIMSFIMSCTCIFIYICMYVCVCIMYMFSIHVLTYVIWNTLREREISSGVSQLPSNSSPLSDGVLCEVYGQVEASASDAISSIPVTLLAIPLLHFRTLLN